MSKNPRFTYSNKDGERKMMEYPFIVKSRVKKVIKEHKDCKHEYCNLSERELPCWKYILIELGLND